MDACDREPCPVARSLVLGIQGWHRPGCCSQKPYPTKKKQKPKNPRELHGNPRKLQGDTDSGGCFVEEPPFDSFWAATVKFCGEAGVVHSQ